MSAVLDAPLATFGPSPAPIAPVPLCILVVDDNVDAAESLGLLLSFFGHAVTTAGDGLSAQAIAATQTFDAFVLDLGLPGLDGFQLAAAVLALPHERRPLVVALSGYGSAEHRRQSAAAGFDRHFVKPVEPMVLLDLLAQFGAGRLKPAS